MFEALSSRWLSEFRRLWRFDRDMLPKLRLLHLDVGYRRKISISQNRRCRRTNSVLLGRVPMPVPKYVLISYLI